MLRAWDRCFPCVFIQIFSFGNDQHKCHTADTCKYHAARQNQIPFCKPTIQDSSKTNPNLNTIRRSDKMTARTFSSLLLETRRSQGSSDLLHFEPFTITVMPSVLFPGGLEGNVLRLWIVANPNDQRFWTPSHKHGLHSSEYAMLKAPKWTHECIRASSKRVWRWRSANSVT